MWAVALLALIDGSVATNATSTTSSTVSPTPTPSPTMRFRAVYGSGGMKTWAEAQKQCQAWNGNLAKVDATDSTVKERLKKIKCSDVLWVGAQESPKAKGVNKDGWKWISDGSKVSTETWRTYYGGGEPNNYGGKEEECGWVGWQVYEVAGLSDAICSSKLYFLCEIPGLASDEMVRCSARFPPTALCALLHARTCSRWQKCAKRFAEDSRTSRSR